MIVNELLNEALHSLTDCRMTDFAKYSAFRALKNVRTLKQFSLKNTTINEETGREIAT